MSVILKHPFTAMISGPTGSGKTQFALRLIDNASTLIKPLPRNIIWCYGIFQSMFKRIKNVQFMQGIPNITDFDENTSTLLIIDDLMDDVNSSTSQIFTKGSHHRNISVVFLTQNLFHGSKHTRTMNLNTHYLIIFKNPRDAMQISHVGRQMYPGKSQFLVEAFRDATKRPYGYLFIDMKPDTDEKLRILSDIFPDDKTVVYLPK